MTRTTKPIRTTIAAFIATASLAANAGVQAAEHIKDYDKASHVRVDSGQTENRVVTGSRSLGSTTHKAVSRENGLTEIRARTPVATQIVRVPSVQEGR